MIIVKGNIDTTHKIVYKVTDRLVFYSERDYDYIESLTLVSKAMKQEVIGYELLKDLPGIPKGTKSTPFLGLGRGGVTFSAIGYFNVTDLQLQDTTWFKPIYKAKDVVVKISGRREVKITADKVDFDGVEFCTFNQINNIYAAVSNRHIATGIKSYPFQITAFKIGCQEFTKEDIEAVYKAIKSLE